jgi:hypothetical protein
MEKKKQTYLLDTSHSEHIKIIILKAFLVILFHFILYLIFGLFFELYAFSLLLLLLLDKLIPLRKYETRPSYHLGGWKRVIVFIGFTIVFLFLIYGLMIYYRDMRLDEKIQNCPRNNELYLAATNLYEHKGEVQVSLENNIYSDGQIHTMGICPAEKNMPVIYAGDSQELSRTEPNTFIKIDSIKLSFITGEGENFCSVVEYSPKEEVNPCAILKLKALCLPLSSGTIYESKVYLNGEFYNNQFTTTQNITMSVAGRKPFWNPVRELKRLIEKE